MTPRRWIIATSIAAALGIIAGVFYGLAGDRLKLGLVTFTIQAAILVGFLAFLVLYLLYGRE